MLIRRLVVGAVAAGLVVVAAGVVSAQDYPNKPIRILTGPPGTGSDLSSRQVAQGISPTLGQPVIVDNRLTRIAIETAAKSPPDGYTLMVNGASVWTIPLLQKAAYDPVRDLAPVSLLARSVNALAVHPSVPAKSVKELIALAKANPGKLNFSSGGNGQGSHLAGELFKSLASINIVHVPYKGSGAALTALVAGEVHLAVSEVALAMTHAKSGKLRVLAVTSLQPSTLYPELPTVAASGVPGYEAVSIAGIWAPAKTPGAIISRLSKEIVRALGLPEVKERYASIGEEIVGSSPEQFTSMIAASIAMLSQVIKDAGIKVD